MSGNGKHKGRGQGNWKWPPETIEAAYQIYCREGGLNVAETARRLSVIRDEEIPYSTVLSWHDSGEWDRRRLTESKELVARSTALHVEELQVAAPESVSFLRSLVSGKSPTKSTVPLSDRIAAARHIEQAARQLLVEQARLNAKRKPGESKPVPDTAVFELDGLSSEELQQLEAQRRRDRDTEDY